ncbi:MAG: ATP-binding protein [Chitinophagales bacterium]
MYRIIFFYSINVNTISITGQNFRFTKAADIRRKPWNMAKQVVGSLQLLYSNGITAMRSILFLTGTICLVMAVTSTHEYNYGLVNWIQGILALIVIGFTYTAFGEANYLMFGHGYIILLDLLNMIPIISSRFIDKFSYQYIIFFFVSSLFFRDKKSLLMCVGVNVAGLILLLYFPATNSSSLLDFYYSCLLCMVSLSILMLYRFDVETKLAESEKQYRLITENSADIICTHQPSGILDFASPSLYHLTGYSPGELKGISPMKFIHEEDLEKLKAMARTSVNGESDRIFQYRFRKKNGEYIWLETLVKDLKSDGDTSDSNFLSQTRSFQKNHLYQEEIERKNVELKASYNDMEMFAYIASHDMQEPLRMISSYMQLLKRRYANAAEDAESVEFIDYALRGASNLQALTRDLLAYSTLNKKELNITEVDLQQLLDDITNDLKMLLQERNVILEIPERFPTYYCDKNAIRQLLQNLIQNAIKYNTSQQPVVSISFKPINKAMIFCVRDNGIGIEMQYAQTIFEPFKRLHTKNQYAGTGLGLSICKRIIDRHAGNIWVESQINHGSSFYFTIPSVERLLSFQNDINRINL